MHVYVYMHEKIAYLKFFLQNIIIVTKHLSAEN